MHLGRQSFLPDFTDELQQGKAFTQGWGHAGAYWVPESRGTGHLVWRQVVALGGGRGL